MAIAHPISTKLFYVRSFPVKLILITVVLFFYNLSPCNAYSVFTHEAIIDVNWEKLLVPLLKQKYPGVSSDSLKEAHAYAYGGSVAPDLGYYPFGSRLFTNLVHYVRSGDFVQAMLADAQNINEYAFALGFLCHYYADWYGHSIGINKSVAIMYPKMKKKFGDTVTYADDHISHLRTEFSFDVLQTARGTYASTAYHNFIGFKVARQLVERVFMQTYGLDVNNLFGDFGKAIARFRWTVINLLPEITKVAWQTQKNTIKKLTPDAKAKSFIYKVKRKSYSPEFDDDYKKPGILAHLLAIAVRMAPKIGPFRPLNFEPPFPEAEDLFIHSFDTTVLYYGRAIAQLSNGELRLVNINYDTGNKTAPGEYKPGDESYNLLLLKLRDKNFETLNTPLKQNILNFYSQTKTIEVEKNEIAQWQKTKEALEQMKIIKPASSY
jgi:hypothetical protein